MCTTTTKKNIFILKEHLIMNFLIIYIFDYAPECLYDNLIRRNDIDGQ